jgi:sugar phosphate isomerase/epimerase
MHGITRRELLKIVPGGALVSLAGTASLSGQSPYPAALGVQLYTVRTKLGPAADATLETIAAIGYREVETTADALATVVPLLKKHGLASPSGHFPYEAMAGRAPSDAFRTSVAQAAELGMKFYVIPYLFAQQRTSLEDYRRIADSLNEAARAVKAAGLQLCYHHHSFEFDSLPAEGGRAERGWDILMSRCDKDLVGLEVDVFWLATAGLDPAGTILDLGRRAKLLHLKDRARDAPQTFNEGKVPPTAFKEVGSGGLDFAGILRAARTVGAAHCFVEQDQTPGDPTASLRQSFQYLQTVKL